MRRQAGTPAPIALRGSWLVTCDSRFVARDSWLVVHRAVMSL